MATSEFPKDMLIEIFSRLPAKSVGKCRCLAKRWRTLLSTPQFIKSHLTRRPHQESLLLVAPSRFIHSIDAIKNGGVSRMLELPNNWARIFCSCDGLVLLCNKDNEMFLLNPITLQQVRIPDSPLALNRKEGFIMYGFGYDRVGDDYKIATLSYKYNYAADMEDDPDSVDTFVDVYSVKMGVWRRVGISPYNHVIHQVFSGAFVNGAIHWAVCRKSKEASSCTSVIAAFDLAREAFYEIPAPNGVDMEQLVPTKLAVLEGCLCMVQVQQDIRTYIWIMKEYGLIESWTNFIIDTRRLDQWYRNVYKPICFLGEEEVVMAIAGGHLAVYNTEVNTMRAMRIDGVRPVFLGVCTFLGSLISPAFISATEATHDPLLN